MNKNICLQKKKDMEKKKKEKIEKNAPICSSLCGYVAENQLCKDVGAGAKKSQRERERCGWNAFNIVRVTMYRKKATSVSRKELEVIYRSGSNALTVRQHCHIFINGGRLLKHLKTRPLC